MNMGPAPAGANQERRKHLKKLNHSPNIGRFAIVNHYKSKVDELTPTSKFPRLSAFLPQNFLPWVWNYLKFALPPRFPCPDPSRSRTRCIYTVMPTTAEGVRLAIAGDWGTGTQEAETIAALMERAKPDLTIHLGDVYYVGGKDEIGENCFGE